MRDIRKYQGSIPAFYACCEPDGSISADKTKQWARKLVELGEKGVYVCGSSGECIYLNREERKKTLEAAEGKLTIIAYEACNNTADSVELAAHAESLDVDAIASIPPMKNTHPAPKNVPRKGSRIPCISSTGIVIRLSKSFHRSFPG